MPGYKVVLIILLVLSILGGIGFTIYYIITGGNDNSLSTFETYSKQFESEQNIYLEENLGKSEYSEFFDEEFAFWFECDRLEKLVYNELSVNLCFAERKANKKGELEAKINEYANQQKATFEKLKIFIERKNYFETESSANGTNISEGERTQLKNLATDVKVKFKSQVNLLCDINKMLVPFVQNSCLKTSFDSSLKYSILNVAFFHSNYYNSLLNEDKMLSVVYDDAENILKTYNQANQQNFLGQTDFNSADSQFLVGLNFLTDEIKSEFFNTENKQIYKNAQGSLLKINLEYIINYFSFGGQK